MISEQTYEYCSLHFLFEEDFLQKMDIITKYLNENYNHLFKNKRYTENYQKVLPLDSFKIDVILNGCISDFSKKLNQLIKQDVICLFNFYNMDLIPSINIMNGMITITIKIDLF